MNSPVITTVKLELLSSLVKWVMSIVTWHQLRCSWHPMHQAILTDKLLRLMDDAICLEDKDQRLGDTYLKQ